MMKNQSPTIPAYNGGAHDLAVAEGSLRAAGIAFTVVSACPEPSCDVCASVADAIAAA
ncbi:MAG: hypothetical protein ACR2JP_11165 [Acidimicrobiia bacterium]